MNVLAIDAATETLALALRAGERMYSRVAREGLRHAQSLVPQIGQLLAQAGLSPGELDLVVAGTGPGSFTGLRIALATARGLVRGASCALVGVPTLDAMGWAARAWPALVVPVVDAKKDRVYAALYRRGQRVSDFLDVGTLELLALIASEPDVLLTGPFAPRIGASGGRPGWVVDPSHEAPNPLALLDLGTDAHARGDGADALPVYLRRSEAEYAKR